MDGKEFVDDFYVGMARAGAGMFQEAGETIQAFMECPDGMAYLTIENALLAVWNYDETAVKVADGVCNVIRVMASDDNVAKSEIANRVLFGAMVPGAGKTVMDDLFKGVKQSRAELAAASRAGKVVPRRLSTGAGNVDVPDAGAAARYSHIVGSLDDATIGQLARHADVPEGVIRSVKAHVFETVHPIQVAPGVVKPGRFTPMNEIADVWEAALRGEGREAFRNLLGHEYLESTLMKHCGLPFRPLADPSGMAVSAHNLSPSPWSGQFHPVQLQLWNEFLSQ